MKPASKPARPPQRSFGYVAFAIVSIVAIAAIVNVAVNGGTRVNDSELFPDEALQRYIGEYVDTDKDGKLSDEEIYSVTHLEGFEDQGITSLKGIEIFKNLQTLDASNAGASELFRTYESEFFAAHENERLPNLEVLILNGNELKSLSFSDSCSNLKELYCSTGLLERISVEKLDGLTTLDCSYNQLAKLDVSEAAGLTSVNCSFNQIANLELPPSIVDLNCSDNLIEGIHFDTGYSGGGITLNSLYCQNNQIVSIVSGSGIAWSSIGLSSDAAYDIENNPGIRIEYGDDGSMWIDFDQLNP